MTQEEKDLLLKDLCARLPYGVICHYDVIVPMVGKVKSYDKLRAISEFDNKPCFQFGCNKDIFDFENIKPYLFPLSSMTEEQRQELESLMEVTTVPVWGEILSPTPEYYDWLNKNHFDYRSLIEKGLANDATELDIY